MGLSYLEGAVPETRLRLDGGAHHGLSREMVLREVPEIKEAGQSPRYLIGATAKGQQALQGEQNEKPLGVGDMVFLRSDAHVGAWVMSSGPDPMDLLVVVWRPGERFRDTWGVTPTGG